MRNLLLELTEDKETNASVFVVRLVGNRDIDCRHATDGEESIAHLS